VLAGGADRSVRNDLLVCEGACPTSRLKYQLSNACSLLISGVSHIRSAKPHYNLLPGMIATFESMRGQSHPKARKTTVYVADAGLSKETVAELPACIRTDLDRADICADACRRCGEACTALLATL
jgi:ferredoxin